MKVQLKLFCLLSCLLFSQMTFGQTIWEMVTDYTSLNVADTFVIAGCDDVKPISGWHTLKNNEVSTEDNLSIGSTITIANNQITSPISEDETWLLERTSTDGAYYIKSTKSGNYYLQYSSSTKCLISSTKPKKDENRRWRIHFNDTDFDNVYSVTGLFNVGANRTLAIFSDVDYNVDWRCYGRQNYRNIPYEEVVLFRKVVSSSISSAEYATFSCEYALDFSGEEGLKVYTAEVNEAKTKVILREVTSKRVPANTAVVLHGAAGSYTGSIVAEAGAITGNDLQIAGETMNGNGNIYVLNRVDGVVGFYKLKTTGTLAKGKAYITLEGNTGAPMLSMSEDSEVTAIEVLPTDACQYQKGYYTLDGRRVERPTKGVYVVDGRKIVVK